MSRRMVAKFLLALSALAWPVASVADDEAPRPPALPSGIRIKPACIKASNRVLIHVAIPTVYTFKGKNVVEAIGRHKSNVALWQIQCEPTGECDGALLQFEDDGIGFLHFGPIKGARLVSSLPSQTIIQWGSWRTFTVDFEQNAVIYRESGPTTEGYGVGACTAEPRKTSAPDERHGKGEDI